MARRELARGRAREAILSASEWASKHLNGFVKGLVATALGTSLAIAFNPMTIDASTDIEQQQGKEIEYVMDESSSGVDLEEAAAPVAETPAMEVAGGEDLSYTANFDSSYVESVDANETTAFVDSAVDYSSASIQIDESILNEFGFEEGGTVVAGEEVAAADDQKGNKVVEGTEQASEITAGSEADEAGSDVNESASGDEAKAEGEDTKATDESKVIGEAPAGDETKVTDENTKQGGKEIGSTDETEQNDETLEEASDQQEVSKIEKARQELTDNYGVDTINLIDELRSGGYSGEEIASMLAESKGFGYESTEYKTMRDQLLSYLDALESQKLQDEINQIGDNTSMGDLEIEEEELKDDSPDDGVEIIEEEIPEIPIPDPDEPVPPVTPPNEPITPPDIPVIPPDTPVTPDTPITPDTPVTPDTPITPDTPVAESSDVAPVTEEVAETATVEGASPVRGSRKEGARTTLGARRDAQTEDMSQAGPMTMAMAGSLSVLGAWAMNKMKRAEKEEEKDDNKDRAPKMPPLPRKMLNPEALVTMWNEPFKVVANKGSMRAVEFNGGEEKLLIDLDKQTISLFKDGKLIPVTADIVDQLPESIQGLNKMLSMPTEPNRILEMCKKVNDYVKTNWDKMNNETKAYYKEALDYIGKTRIVEAAQEALRQREQALDKNNDLAAEIA